jgi:hypothetical protein
MPCQNGGEPIAVLHVTVAGTEPEASPASYRGTLCCLGPGSGNYAASHAGRAAKAGHVVVRGPKRPRQRRRVPAIRRRSRMTPCPSLQHPGTARPTGARSQPASFNAVTVKGSSARASPGSHGGAHRHAPPQADCPGHRPVLGRSPAAQHTAGSGAGDGFLRVSKRYRSVADAWTNNLHQSQERCGGGQLPVRQSPSSRVSPGVPVSQFGSGLSGSQLSDGVFRVAGDKQCLHTGRAATCRLRGPGERGRCQEAINRDCSYRRG